MNTANWDMEAHGAPGSGSWARWARVRRARRGRRRRDSLSAGGAAKKKENFANRRTPIPELKCYLPGVPRATYMPYPFQIVQSRPVPDLLRIRGRVRTINMRSRPRPVDSWMGWSRALGRRDAGGGCDRPERPDLVRPRGRLSQRRAARGGALHAAAPHILMYEATIEDPKVSRGPGRSAARSTGTSRRTRSCWNSSAWSFPRNYSTATCARSHSERQEPTCRSSCRPMAAPLQAFFCAGSR